MSFRKTEDDSKSFDTCNYCITAAVLIGVKCLVFHNNVALIGAKFQVSLSNVVLMGLYTVIRPGSHLRHNDITERSRKPKNTLC